jgi:multicomponent Na+:H+ antiporter subunit F
MLVTAAIAVLVVMALVLVRALLGPTVYDRILAVNMFGTKTVLLIALMAFISGRLDVLDIALAYALINFIGVIAVLRFFEYGDLTESQNDSPIGSSAEPERRA